MRPDCHRPHAARDPYEAAVTEQRAARVRAVCARVAAQLRRIHWHVVAVEAFAAAARINTPEIMQRGPVEIVDLAAERTRRTGGAR